MPFNPKSLDNLKPFKKGDKTGKKEASQKGKEKIKENKTTREIINLMLKSRATPENLKKLKAKYPDMSDEDFTVKTELVQNIINIIYKGERDTDKLAAFTTIMQYSGDDPEAERAKQTAQSYEDDPFSKSIKELSK